MLIEPPNKAEAHVIEQYKELLTLLKSNHKTVADGEKLEGLPDNLGLNTFRAGYLAGFSAAMSVVKDG